MSFKQFLHHLNRRDTRLLPRFSTLAKIICLAVFVIGSFLVLHQVLAAASLEEFQTVVSAGTASQETWLWNAAHGSVYGADMDILGKFIFEKGKLKMWVYKDSVIGTTTKAISYLYTPPASGTEYIASVWGNFLGGKSAYAANGVGFNGLQPLLPIWKNFRDAVYAFSAIVFVIIGIMIMLRVKISPQAVITIQSAIPQLIITLILVTFSYAIAGLLIDASYVFQGLAITIIDPQMVSLSSIFTPFLTGGINIVAMFTSLLPTVQNVANPSFTMAIAAIAIPSVVIVLFSSVIGGVIFAIFGLIGGAGDPAVAVVAGGIAFALILLVFSIIIIVWVVQFFFGLFKCYATLIFKIVIAPLEIGMGAFPNSKMGFSSWIWDVISNLAVFPISFTVLYLSNMIVLSIFGPGTVQSFFNNLSNGSLGAGLWAPAMLGGTGLSGLIAVGAISIATLSLLPKLPEMIPQFVFMIKPSPWGQAIGQAMSLPPAIRAGATGFAAKQAINEGLGGVANYYDREETRLRGSGNPADIAAADRYLRIKKGVGTVKDIADKAAKDGGLYK